MPITNEIYRQVPRSLVTTSSIILHRGKIVKDRFGALPISPYIDENIVIDIIEREYEIAWYNRREGILILNKRFNI